MKNNSRVGFLFEKTICQLYKIEYLGPLVAVIDFKITNVVTSFKNNFIILFKSHMGRGRSHVDFVLNTGQTVSVKTNQISLKQKSKNSYKLCPQKIGQCSRATFDLVFSLINILNDTSRKNYIIKNIHKILKQYFWNLFCCDFLVYFYPNGKEYTYLILKKPTKYPFQKDIKLFLFTNNFIKNSTVVKYKDIAIGEFQFHKNRDCIKFRWFSKNLLFFLGYEM